MKYKAIITKGDFLTPKEFVKIYSDENKGIKAVVEDTYRGNIILDDIHTSGYTERVLNSTTFEDLKKELKIIYNNENLRGECIGVYLIKDTKLETEIYTEDDFNFWNI